MRFRPALDSTLGLAACILAAVAGTLSLPSSAGRLGPPEVAAASEASGTEATPALALKVAGSQVVEYYHAGLDHFFITSDPAEQAFVDTGAVGAWQRTGNTFPTGGPNQVCRFYGSFSPGPNSHFYTADPAECEFLKQLQATTPATQKRWNFESNDFMITPAVGGACPAGLVPVYRAYNNGFARGIDSNHRITSNLGAYQQTVAAGWIGEGIVMCAPGSQGGTLPSQLGACGSSGCPPGATRLGNGLDLVVVIVTIANTTATPIELVIPAGQTFVSTTTTYQDGLAIERLQATISPGATGTFLLRLFCMNADRHASEAGALYAPGPITTNPNLLDLIALADGKLGPSLDPATVKASMVQLAIWEITNGPGALTSQQRSLLVALLATAGDDVLTQANLAQQFQATLSLPG
jgi:hypothetical protein